MKLRQQQKERNPRSSISSKIGGVFIGALLILGSATFAIAEPSETERAEMTEDSDPPPFEVNLLGTMPFIIPDVNLCTDASSLDESACEGTYSLHGYCYDWNRNQWTDERCRDTPGRWQSDDINSIGVGYCPREGQADCEENGSPTEGVVGAHIVRTTHSGHSTAAYYCRDFVWGNPAEERGPVYYHDTGNRLYGGPTGSDTNYGDDPLYSCQDMYEENKWVYGSFAAGWF